jgi:hypothetical protein
MAKSDKGHGPAEDRCWIPAGRIGLGRRGVVTVASVVLATLLSSCDEGDLLLAPDDVRPDFMQIDGDRHYTDWNEYTSGVQPSDFSTWWDYTLHFLVEANRFHLGSWAFIGSVPFQNTPGGWYWLPSKAEGTNLRVRAWGDGMAEPSAWT